MVNWIERHFGRDACFMGPGGSPPIGKFDGICLKIHSNHEGCAICSVNLSQTTTKPGSKYCGTHRDRSRLLPCPQAPVVEHKSSCGSILEFHVDL